MYPLPSPAICLQKMDFWRVARENAAFCHNGYTIAPTPRVTKASVLSQGMTV
jgi:hypothetical protein